MDTPPAPQRETLLALAVEVANLASDLSEQVHELTNVSATDPDAEMLVRVYTTKALWARDLLANAAKRLSNDNS